MYIYLVVWWLDWIYPSGSKYSGTGCQVTQWSLLGCLKLNPDVRREYVYSLNFLLRLQPDKGNNWHFVRCYCLGFMHCTNTSIRFTKETQINWGWKSIKYFLVNWAIFSPAGVLVWPGGPIQQGCDLCPLMNKEGTAEVLWDFWTNMVVSTCQTLLIVMSSQQIRVYDGCGNC